MATFNIYTKDVKIGDEVYQLRPLTGRFLPQLYDVIGKLANDKEEIDVKQLNEENITALQTLALETFKKSYPNEDENRLDEFVSQNLMVIVGPLVELNLGKNV